MGITITANNSKHSFKIGYGTFYLLRSEIAKCLDYEFGKQYASLLECDTAEERKARDEVTDKMARQKHLDEDVLAFLFASDCDGEVPYKTCGKLYSLIKYESFNHKRPTYDPSRDDTELIDFDRFKEFLLDCYSYRRKMRWH